MAVQEKIQTGQYYRIFTGTTGGIDTYDRLSFWSKAIDCELNNGLNVNEVLGDSKGFTSSINSDAGYLADIQAVKDLSEDIKTNILNNIKFKSLTKAEYNALTPKDENTLYIIVS